MGWLDVQSGSTEKNQRLQREGDLFFLPCLCFSLQGKQAELELKKEVRLRAVFVGVNVAGSSWTGGWVGARGAKGEGEGIKTWFLHKCTRKKLLPFF